MNFTDIQQGLALFEIAAACAVIAMLCVRSKQMWIGLGVFVLLLIPMRALPLAGYIRGFTGDLSVVSFLLLLSLYCFPVRKPVSIWVALCVALFGAVFYAGALGVGMIDPYAWGYGSLPMVLSVIGIALCCGLLKYERLTIVLSVAMMAWAVGLHESTNLWDYLVDPYLFIFLLLSAFVQRYLPPFSKGANTRF